MSDPKPPPSGPPVPHVLAGELARVRVAVARAKDDLAQGRMPVLSDLESMVAGVCATVERVVRPDRGASFDGRVTPVGVHSHDDSPARLGAGMNTAEAQALEVLLAELNSLEDEVRLFRARMDRLENG